MKSSNIFLSIAIIIAALILGISHYSSRSNVSTVKVVGYATQEFESDLIKWSFNITEQASMFELRSGYKVLNQKLKKMKEIISSKNLEEVQIDYKPIRINDVYDRNGITSDKKLTQEVVVTTKSLDDIVDLSIDPSVFIDNNILFEYSNINFYYTKLDDVKKELLGKAILNAKDRAEEILSAVNKKVGDLSTARSGVFQITEPLSTEVAGYGLHSTSTKNKNIKVTVSAEFEIK